MLGVKPQQKRKFLSQISQNRTHTYIQKAATNLSPISIRSKYCFYLISILFALPFYVLNFH